MGSSLFFRLISVSLFAEDFAVAAADRVAFGLPDNADIPARLILSVTALRLFDFVSHYKSPFCLELIRD
jgi:hypothetical protein